MVLDATSTQTGAFDNELVAEDNAPSDARYDHGRENAAQRCVRGETRVCRNGRSNNHQTCAIRNCSSTSAAVSQCSAMVTPS